MNYASIKGRAGAAPNDRSAPARPLDALSDVESAAIAARKAACEAHAPEFARFLREAYALRMIDGWRALERVTIEGVVQ
jgi:hypothetical protein